ncbi:CcmD family protein [Sphingobacterium bambusae]|uniref:CcmD family protein n=2 Tax=Sphingobacterium bambusae TaxID=662858 RepID=A0ABW6BEL7_9SPHI|nr:CcmD family protein [Sphingobacterium bambusae]WPL50479.1 CcmD family protein [Sphingobacterium bambusae]
MMKNSIAAILLFLSSSNLFAQGDIEMATGLRSSGKIYVVVLVLLTIFAVLGISLFLLDRRIKKLEK